MRRFRIGMGALALTAAVAATGLLGALTALPALAHTTQNQGPYALTFGWGNEPAYTGLGNTVQLFVHQGSPTGNPVGNIQGLTVQVTAGGVTSPPLALTYAFDPDTGLGNPAEYDAPLIPTIVGTYTFHITGSINGTKVDVSASSGDTTFDTAHDPSAIEFPAQPPGPATLAAAVQNLQSALATETAVAADARSAASAARSAATTARAIAVAALIVAILLGVVAFIRSRRKPGAGTAP